MSRQIPRVSPIGRTGAADVPAVASGRTGAAAGPAAASGRTGAAQIPESPAGQFGPPNPTGLAARPGGHGLPGQLIVLEGIDGSGRSTHARLLEDRLRYRGRGATRTSLATSAIAAEPIRRAKRDARVGPVGTALLYAADLAERTEQVILPALRAGLVVIADRYAYTPMARSEARGVDPVWLDDLFGFVVPPDLVLFLDIDPGTVLARRGADPDPYEAGSDLHLGTDLVESYRLFQGRLYDCLRRSAARFGFTIVPATAPIASVERRLERAVAAVLDPAEPRASWARVAGSRR